MPRKLRPDLLALRSGGDPRVRGVVMVYSASAIVAADRFHDPFFFLKKQLFWAVLGLGCLWAGMLLDYRNLERFVMPLLVVSFVLLVLVLVPPFGQSINGTRRWLRVGPVSFQPVELAKFALVLYLAAFLTRRQEVLARFTEGLLPLLLVAGGMAGLILLQPDLGNGLALVILTLVLAYLAGARVQHMGLIAAAALPVVIGADRAQALPAAAHGRVHEPVGRSAGRGFQIIQSFLALGSGGWLGRGLGESKQKLFYLPEPHTDFIFAIIGEELGLVGATVIVALFALLIWRGLRIGLRAPDPFGGLPGARAHHHARHPDHREPGRGDRGAADQGAAAAVHLLRGLRAAHDDVLGGRAAEHLAARGERPSHVQEVPADPLRGHRRRRHERHRRGPARRSATG